MSIRVLIVDDSALMRQILTSILDAQPDIEVVGAARDPYDAWDKLKANQADVLTLDVEMPRMDGLAFLEKLMVAKPMPVVMISSLTEKGCETTLKALEIGAVDFVSKPKIDLRDGTIGLAEEIIYKVRAAAQARPRSNNNISHTSRGPASIKDRSLIQSTHKVIAIGASTGGTEALSEVLTALPADSPGIVMVQHMPPGFTRTFSERLNSTCRIQVREAKDGDRILPGHALLAPGGRHMKVCREGASYLVRLSDEAPVNRFRPSVDVLFKSCARHLGKHTIAAILTGMGADGAQGIEDLAEAGASCIAQDEQSCVVFGMPKAAIATGCISTICPLSEIAQQLLNASCRKAEKVLA